MVANIIGSFFIRDHSRFHVFDFKRILDRIIMQEPISNSPHTLS